MHDPRRSTLPFLFAVLGVALGVVVAMGGLGWIPRGNQAPGKIAFKGVNLTIAYTGVWPGIFGPENQDACLQRVGSPFDSAPNCPVNLTGGQRYNFDIFDVFAPINITNVFANISIQSPIPLNAGICFVGLPLPPPTRYWNLSDSVPSGILCGWGVTFTMPDPVPAFPGGLWLQANMTVHVV